MAPCWTPPPQLPPSLRENCPSQRCIRCEVRGEGGGGDGGGGVGCRSGWGGGVTDSRDPAGEKPEPSKCLLMFHGKGADFIGALMGDMSLIGSAG